MNYDDLLTRAMEKVPKRVESTERFELPKVKGHLQGNKTVISNFLQISDLLQRKPEHLLKFLLKELATPGELQKTILIIGTKVNASRINDKIKQYADEFVICKECKKPDTKIIKEGEFTFLKCQACGAKHSIRQKI